MLATEVSGKITGMRMCIVFSMASLISAGAITCYFVWFYARVVQLGQQYGWGHIPPAEYPIAPASLQPVLTDLGYGAIAIFLIGSALFLAAIGYARSVVSSLPNYGGFTYSWGWTLASLIIPFWVLYRPWVGLAEIRRATFGISRRQSVSPDWKKDGFSGATLFLAVAVLLALTTIKLITNLVEEEATRQPIGLTEISEIANFMVVAAIARLGYVAVLGWYSMSLYAKTKKLVELAVVELNVQNVDTPSNASGAQNGQMVYAPSAESQ